MRQRRLSREVRVRIPWRVMAFSAALVAVAGGIQVGGQQPSMRAFTASGASVAAAAAEVDGLLRGGRLDIDRVDTDTMIDGRTHERLGQRYEGLPVFDGELIRQVDGGRVVSIFGRI